MWTPWHDQTPVCVCFTAVESMEQHWLLAQFFHTNYSPCLTTCQRDVPAL